MFASRSRAAAAAANGGGGGSIADDTRRGAKVDRVVCRGDPSLGTKQAFKIKLELSPPSATLREKDCFERFNLVDRKLGKVSRPKRRRISLVKHHNANRHLPEVPTPSISNFLSLCYNILLP